MTSRSDPDAVPRWILWFGRDEHHARYAREGFRSARVVLRVTDALEQIPLEERTACAGVIVTSHGCPEWRTLPARLRASWPEGPPIVVLLDDEAAGEGRVPGADAHLLVAAPDWPRRLVRLLQPEAAAPAVVGRGPSTPARTTAADQPAVDLSGLRTMFAELGAESSDVQALVDTYLEELPSAFARLEEAVHTGAPETVAAAAHALKSPSATLGAATLAELLRRLEEMGRNGDLSHAQHLLELVRLEAERVRAALGRELRGGIS